MAYSKDIFKQNFLEYASYVIKDRAIPDIEDGLKPVQRRILHTLIKMDDGRMNKVANVVGSAMHYHPHGDSSIYSALVNLANCGLFIDTQGNFGNYLTGDPAAAARYIECRIKPFAKEVLYNPEITEYVDSYDGRSQEPVVFPAKIPVVIIQGTEGIAVGMSTKILPHNAKEVINAQISALRNEPFELFPDFPGGGIMDVSDYQDGLGSIAVRAKLDTSNPKKIVITQLPYGVDSEKMIASIEAACKKGRLKIQSVDDYTAETANIEICLSKGTYTKDVVDALYAYTLCEQKISVNCLLIKDNLPHVMPISDVIKYHAEHLVKVSKAELEVQKNHLTDSLHAKTLEKLFIEERIYKRIEQKKTQEAVNEAVFSGFEPYADQLIRPLTQEDVERLLKIPIRSISIFDIEKNEADILSINEALKEVNYNLKHLVEYSIKTLEKIRGELSAEMSGRKTVIEGFETIDVKDVARRDLDLRYDSDSGYLGTGVKTGDQITKVSEYDKILIIQKDGTYYTCPVEEKKFVGNSVVFVGLSDKASLENMVFTIIYTCKSTKISFIKRFKFTGGFIMNKVYELLPDIKNNSLRKLSVFENAECTLSYKPGSRVKESTFEFDDFRIKSPKALGVQLTKKEIASIRLKSIKHVERPQEEESPETEAEDLQPEIRYEAPSLPEKEDADDDNGTPSLFG